MMGAGANLMPGGKPPLPPGAVASGGGGPPPLPGAVSPYGQQSGAVDPQRMAMAENFRRQSMRGNREGRALSPMQIDAMYSSILRGPTGGGGGGGAMQSVVTPGGGNQNAFSPQAAKVSQVPATGGFDPSSMRLMLARLMAAGGGANKFSSTGDRQGGYG
jgi:hypothetical protein